MAVAGSQSTGENVIHVGAVRVRGYGNGTVNLRLIGLGNIEEQELASAILDDFTHRPFTILANFIQTRAQVELKTTELGDLMIVSRIIVYTKPIWTSFPQ